MNDAALRRLRAALAATTPAPRASVLCHVDGTELTSRPAHWTYQGLAFCTRAELDEYLASEG